MKRLTPVLLVEDFAESMRFWHEQLGFTVTVQVAEDPEGNPEGPAGFAILECGAVQLMLQSRSSVENDTPGILPEGQLAKHGVGLFVEVEEPLDVWLPKLQGLEVTVERRDTFYGADEIGVLAPDGATLVLAHFADGPQ